MAALFSNLLPPPADGAPRVTVATAERQFDEIEYRASAMFGYAWVGACIVGIVKILS